MSQDPNLDFEAHGLVRDLNDDWLVASAIQAKTHYSPVRVSLVTADFGLEVKASLHLNVFQMPEALRIPEELDSDEKKLLELQRRLTTIESASPILQVTFPNQKTFSPIELFHFEPWPEERKREELEKARAEHPKIPLEVPAEDAPFNLGFISHKDIEAYNHKVAGYHRKLGIFHEQLNNVAAWYNRTAKVKLLLRNVGGAPAEDIDVVVHFPDGTEIVKDDALPSLNKPEPPPAFRNSILSMFEPINLNMAALNLNSFPTPKLPRNAQLLDIKKTKSYEAEFHVQRLKHQNDEELPSIYLHFPKEPISFRAKFRLVAANVPDPVMGVTDGTFSGSCRRVGVPFSVIVLPIFALTKKRERSVCPQPADPSRHTPAVI